MKPELQRIAIAKACDLAIVSDGITHHLTPCGKKTELDPEGCLLKECPDYLNDLNAMREVLQWLFREGVRRNGRALDRYETQDVYLRNLLIACKCPNPELEATAAQQAEAVLRTIGKWEKATG
jgi:hypothetical protein